jgi:hypothetical protein
LWFVKTLDTSDSFEISDLEKAHELIESWRNNVTSAGHFDGMEFFGSQPGFLSQVATAN